MDAPRTFVSFSSSDFRSYRLMSAWNSNENVDFNFKDFQLDEAINSDKPSYIKSVCCAKIRLVDTFILLIGDDTWRKTVFVQREVEAAVEKGCRLIGMNLNNCRFKDSLCPQFFEDRGALFIPFSSRIAAEALDSWKKPATSSGDWIYNDHVYTRLGYALVGETAVLPRLNPFKSGTPPWAR